MPQVPGRAPDAGAHEVGWADVSPFVWVAVIGVLSALVPFPGWGWKLAVLAALAVLAFIAVLVTLGRTDRDSWLAQLGPALLLLTIAAARDFSGGPVSSGLAPLVVLPLLWVAMMGTRAQLMVFGLATAAMFWIPAVLVGAPQYPASEVRRGVLWLLVALVVAPVVQRIVARQRAESTALRETNERLGALTRSAYLTSVVVTDLEGRIEEFSHGSEAMLGYRAQDLIGHSAEVLHDREEIEQVAQELSVPPAEVFEALATSAAPARRWTYRRQDGTPLSVRLVLTPRLDDAGERTGYIGVAMDVTEATRTEQALREQKERTQRLFIDAPHGIVLARPDGEIVQVNDAFADVVGRSWTKLPGVRLPDLTTEPIDVENLLTAALQAPATVHTSDWTVRESGLRLAVTARALVAGDSEAAVLLHVVDVSEQRRHEAELAHLADHDVLTSLVNRRRFERELAAQQARIAQGDQRGGLLLVDLDRFKEVNDTLGHRHGDRLLIQVADMLTGCVRAEDLVARLGGDEFAILLRQGDSGVVERVARDVVAGVESITAHGAGAVRRVTASVGAVTFEGAGGYDWDIPVLADLAMYESKERGRNGYTLISPEQPTLPRAADHLEWRSRIRDALDEDRLVLHVQPILDLRSGRVRSGELLVRLLEDGELLAPGRFLAAAERAGLMPELDTWVVSQAIGVAQQLRRQDPEIVLHVNVSSSSISDPRLEAAWDRAARDLEHGALRVELTETAPVTDPEEARSFSRRMRARGISLALDDFGTGYSSYAHLKLLDIDHVKIDGSFVQAMPHSEIDRIVVRSLVTLAHELGKQVTAEYVSDADVLAHVRACGADQAQGFHIGAPMPVERFVSRFLTGGPGGAGSAGPNLPAGGGRTISRLSKRGW